MNVQIYEKKIEYPQKIFIDPPKNAPHLRYPKNRNQTEIILLYAAHNKSERHALTKEKRRQI